MTTAYPPEYYKTLKEVSCRCAWIVGISGTLAFITAFLAVTTSFVLYVAVVFSAVFIFCFIGAITGIRDSRIAAIIPYFPKNASRVDSPTTFMSGYALAKNCGTLDELAQNAGLQPLSYFGFADDARSEPITWHKASAGLETVQGLIEILQRSTVSSDSATLIKELKLIEARLQEAEKLDVPFCFLLWHGTSVSLYEMDLRQGYI